jgi:large subunit ribosomal protein L10
MPLNRTQKVELAGEIKDKFSRAKVAMFADYKGLSASDADDMRKALRGAGAEVKVLKNNVARMAFKDGALGDDAKQLMDGLAGPVMVAFAYDDPAAAAKAMHEFAEDHEALELKDGLMGQKVIAAADVEALAKLPSREVMLSMLLSALNGPARGFVSVLAAVPRSLVQVLAAVQAKKEEGGS